MAFFFPIIQCGSIKSAAEEEDLIRVIALVQTLNKGKKTVSVRADSILLLTKVNLALTLSISPQIYSRNSSDMKVN